MSLDPWCQPQISLYSFNLPCSQTQSTHRAQWYIVQRILLLTETCGWTWPSPRLCSAWLWSNRQTFPRQRRTFFDLFRLLVEARTLSASSPRQSSSVSTRRGSSLAFRPDALLHCRKRLFHLGQWSGLEKSKCYGGFSWMLAMVSQHSHHAAVSTARLTSCQVHY